HRCGDSGHHAAVRCGRGRGTGRRPGRAARGHPSGGEPRMSTEATNGHGDRVEAGAGSPEPETAKAEQARVYALLLARAGETQVEMRLDATGRACEVLGDIHTAAPTITVTGEERRDA